MVIPEAKAKSREIDYLQSIIEYWRYRAEVAEDACRAVDALWSEDSLQFREEMESETPVGIVWAKVRKVLAY